MFTLPAQRQLPNLVIASPKDEQELRSLVRTALAQDHPFALHYPRDAGFDLPPVEPALIPIGRGELLREGTEILLIGFGPIVARAMEAADRLAAAGWSVGVINARFAKPLDRQLILEEARGKRLIVTLEESVVTGGFGSGVLELLEEARLADPGLSRHRPADRRASRATGSSTTARSPTCAGSSASTPTGSSPRSARRSSSCAPRPAARPRRRRHDGRPAGGGRQRREGGARRARRSGADAVRADRRSGRVGRPGPRAGSGRRSSTSRPTSTTCRRWVERLGDVSGSLPIHTPARGPRLMIVHRREGQMGAVHDHATWVAMSPIVGLETHRRYRVTGEGCSRPGSRSPRRSPSSRPTSRRSCRRMTSTTTAISPAMAGRRTC